jgi:drug/metabolite transporter (DMT)-like permease
MSPVYAAFFALLLNSERLTASMVAGATLMVAASFLVELPPQAGRKDSLDPKVADEVPS